MPYGQVDKLTKLVPQNPANPVSLKQAIEGEPQLQAAAEEPVVERLLAIAQKLEGLHRHASTHAAGVVIGDRPLEELVPLYRDPKSGMRVTQFNMKEHDCGHGAFFGQPRRPTTGSAARIGVLTLTPYDYWRRTHAIHHATAGNLDQRGIGDVDTLTVREYRALSRWGRLGYRLYRHPAGDVRPRPGLAVRLRSTGCPSA